MMEVESRGQRECEVVRSEDESSNKEEANEDAFGSEAEES